MSDKTKIEWTDATWNPITGCSVVSPGCTNCYAMKLAGTRLQHHPSRAGLTQDTKAGPVWNGQVQFNEQWLTQPLKWKRPRRIFVCAHGDLFHENVPDEWIDAVFAVMALAPQHTFQVLTKRPERMRQYLSAARAHSVGLAALGQTLHCHAENPKSHIGKGIILQGDIPHLKVWPLPNLWLGVSAEDQRRANERIPLLLQTPAAVRFLSCEPLLGGVDISRWLFGKDEPCSNCPKDEHCDCGFMTKKELSEPALDWVIVGGESGPGARPMHPDWARSLRDQCQVAGVPFFFKQWGEWEVACSANGHHDCNMERNDAIWLSEDGKVAKPSSKGLANPIALAKVGKKAAGRLLDGREWNEMPGGTA